MCKILAFNNLSKLKKDEFFKLLSVANEQVSKTERDGFGYAAQGASGVFGERAVSPEDFVSVFGGHDKHGSFQAPSDSVQNHFGTLSRLTGPAIFHGRTSTNVKNITNTHPFIKNDVHLIHNGVINFDIDYEKQTTCDSEDLLEAYLLSKDDLEAVEKFVTGYYAVALIENNHLRIFKDSRAWLYCAYVRTIDSFIFGTTKDLVQSVVKAMRWSCGKITRVKDDIYFGLDKDGKELFMKSIKPRIEVYSYAESQAHLSLGYGGKAATSTYKKGDYKKAFKARNKQAFRGHYEYGYDVGFDDDYYGSNYNPKASYVSSITGEEITASEYGILPIDEKREYRKIAD